jgi:hypothetical protein
MLAVSSSASHSEQPHSSIGVSEGFASVNEDGLILVMFEGSLDTDVSVQACRDEACKQKNNINCGLPITRRQALHGGIEGELALETIHDHSKGDVTGIMQRHHMASADGDQSRGE